MKVGRVAWHAGGLADGSLPADVQVPRVPKDWVCGLAGCFAVLAL